MPTVPSAHEGQGGAADPLPARELLSFFYGRQFANDADLNEQAERWLERTANVRRHGTTGERPVDRFERDGILAEADSGAVTAAEAIEKRRAPAGALVSEGGTATLIREIRARGSDRPRSSPCRCSSPVIVR